MLGKKIKDYLDLHGISYSFLANQLGKSMPIVTNILNGKRRILATEYFQICSILNVPFETFFKEKERNE